MELPEKLSPVSYVTSKLDASPRCASGKLSETSDFAKVDRKYLGKWGDFTIYISAWFCICSTPRDDVKSLWHSISTLKSNVGHHWADYVNNAIQGIIIIIGL